MPFQNEAISETSFWRYVKPGNTDFTDITEQAFYINVNRIYTIKVGRNGTDVSIYMTASEEKPTHVLKGAAAADFLAFLETLFS